MKDGMGVLNKKRLTKIANDKSASELKKSIARRKLAILKRDGDKCVVCKSKHDLTIDNKLPRTGVVPPLRNTLEHYKLEDCEVLCVCCHRKVTQKNRERNYPENYKKKEEPSEVTDEAPR
jgi:5-methylcytosine-specific restriction endonuclease McrA